MSTAPHSWSRRGVLQAAGLTGLAALGACGTRDPQQAAASGAVPLQVWTNDPNYISYFTYWAARLSSNPGRYDYRIGSLVQAPDQVVTKMLTSYMSGSPLPDLAGFEISQFSRLQRDDIGGRLAVDLRKEIPGLDRDFYRARIAPYTSDRAVYGLESDMCLAVYYYREDLWKKYGLPTDFESWDDLLEIGAHLHKRHGVSLAAIGTNDIAWLAMLLLQQGGQFFGADGTLRVESDETMRAIDILRRGVHSGAFASFTNFFGAAAAGALNADRIAGYYMPDWFLPFVLKLNAPTQKGKWRLRPLPRFEKGGLTSAWGGTGFGVTKGQRGTRAALDLLKAAYATPEGQVQRYLRASYLPTMKSAWDDPRLRSATSDYLGGQRPFDVFGRVVDTAPPMYTSPYWDVMVSQMVIALSHALGGGSPAAAVRRAADNIRSQMQ